MCNSLAYPRLLNLTLNTVRIMKRFILPIAASSLLLSVLTVQQSYANTVDGRQVSMSNNAQVESDGIQAILSNNAKVEKLSDGFDFIEGPIWDSRGFLLFSDIPADTIYKWTSDNKVSVFRHPAGHPNGNTLDREGRLITAEHDRRITRTEENGTVVTLADRYNGKRLNSPNDVVVKSDGSIYFTDPPYGISPEQEELGFYGVYRLSPDKTLTLLTKQMVRPNGLAFSPNEKKLYVSDSEQGHIRVFQVKPNGTLTNGRIFAQLKEPPDTGVPDGIKVDVQGNVYCSGPEGIWVFSPSGKLLGKIIVPEVVTNLAWGDSDYKTLYITASTSIYRIRLNIAGVQPGGPQALRSDIQIRNIINTISESDSPSVRIVKDPRDNTLYYLKLNGEIYQVDLRSATSSLLYSAKEHGLDITQGMAIGPDGTIYLVGNTDVADRQTGELSRTKATIMKGKIDRSGKQRVWSILATSADYPKSNTAFDHRFNGVVVSPRGDFIYINSGSRTDHGEVQSAGGLYPDTREVGLSAAIFRLPTNGENIFLENNRDALKASGYIFAEGTRNSFDLAFAPNGDLIGTENGPDRDMSEELNWLRSGRHYGFPWRIGGADNPQQFPNYNPANDRLLDPRFIAVYSGYFYNDPTFPPRPSINLTEPIVNLGPDADSFRDPQDGQVKDASDLGQTLNTFTTHRSPLGLTFDIARAMSSEFRGDGFMLSWTEGDPISDTVAGPFKDPSQDLLHLDLVKVGNTNYQVRTTRIVGGFSNPIDAEIINNKIYVLEFGENQGIWEITMPTRLFGRSYFGYVEKNAWLK